MKKNLLVLMMIAGLIFATSCVKDDIDEPTLTLAETEWQAPMEASEKAISVITNQTNWTAAPNAEWVETTQSGNTLTIKVAKNHETITRKAVVKVIAGGIGKDITVIQAATNVSIVTIPDKLEVDQWGGKYQFDVDANTRDWKVISDADWTVVTAKQFKGEVEVEVAENISREARVAKIILESNDGNEKKEFTINQSGIMYHILPYLIPRVNQETVKQFEESRKSSIVMNLDLLFGRFYSFNTKSPAFPQIQYTFTENKLTKVSSVASSSDVMKDPKFEKMMIDEGYIASGNTYTKEVLIGENLFIINASVFIGDDAADETSGVIFTFEPKQTKDMPTFKTIPLGYTGFGSGKAEIDEYEIANGGTYNSKTSEYIFDGGYWYHYYDVNTTELLARAYFVLDDERYGLLETAQYFLDGEKAFFEVDGEAYLTKEFMELATSEGFEYIGFVNRWHRFENATTGYVFLTRWVKYVDMEQKVLDCHVSRLDIDDMSGTAIKGLPKMEDLFVPVNLNSWEARGIN